MTKRLSRLARAGAAMMFLLLATPQAYASTADVGAAGQEIGVVQWVTVQIQSLLGWFSTPERSVTIVTSDGGTPPSSLTNRGEAGSN